MDRIAVALQEVHSSPSEPEPEPAPVVQTNGILSPFARVDGVAPGSPASEAVRRNKLQV